jgi:hypothetical protein
VISIVAKDINKQIAAEISWSRTGPKRPHLARTPKVPATIREGG